MRRILRDTPSAAQEAIARFRAVHHARAVHFMTWRPDGCLRGNSWTSRFLTQCRRALSSRCPPRREVVIVRRNRDRSSRERPRARRIRSAFAGARHAASVSGREPAKMAARCPKHAARCPSRAPPPSNTRCKVVYPSAR
jgi:hypothetical protein